jgi:hypothetical protein
MECPKCSNQKTSEARNVGSETKFKTANGEIRQHAATGRRFVRLARARDEDGRA